MDNFNFTWHLKTKIMFGAGKINNIGTEASTLGKHALLVIGQGSLRHTGKLDKILQLLSDAEISTSIFEGIETNPRVTTVARGAEKLKNENCDFIIGIGGGSVMDAAKAIMLEATTGKPVWDYIALHKNKRPVPEHMKYKLMLVPTMHATGSEMNGNAVLTNEELKQKCPLSDPFLAPDVTLIDPDMSATLTWTQIAYSLIDITSHILEPYLSRERIVPTSLNIIHGIISALVDAGREIQKNPDNPGARAVIAWSGSLACSNLPNLGLNGHRYCHQLEHFLSAYTDIHHALGLAIIIPRWMRRFKSELEDSLIEISSAFHPEKKRAESAEAAIEIFENWLESINLKTSLTEYGITDKSLSGQMAKTLLGIEKLKELFSSGKYAMDLNDMEEFYNSCF